MNKFSRLKSIKATNFMGYDYGVLEFDDSNIINIKGMNSSGKSAMQKSAVVLFFYAFQQHHVKLIKEDKDFFEIEAEFDDGVRIKLLKHRDGKSRYDLYRGEESVFSTVQNGVYTRVTSVPQVIQKYLGFLKDDGLSLHYRRGRDTLLLVDTSGSENYKFLSSVMQLDELLKALSLAKKDVSVFTSQINDGRAKLMVYDEAIAERRIYSDALVAYLEKDVGIHTTLEARKTAGSSLKDLRSELVEKRVLPELGLLPVERLRVLDNCLEDVRNLDSYSITPEVGLLDTSKLNALGALIGLCEEYKALDVKNGVEVPTLAKELSKFEALASLKELGDRYVEKLRGVSELDAQAKEVEKQLSLVSKELDAMGIKFYYCGNCGVINFVGEECGHLE